MKSLTINRSSKIDPTRTSGIRRRFLADMNGRFTELKRDIKISIVDNNCFGIRPLPIANTPIPYHAFGFDRDSQKLEDFLRWLQAQEDAGILSRVDIHGHRLSGNSWMDTYIDSAYMQGIRRARAELQRAGLGNDLYGVDPLAHGTISAAFNMPIHLETVASLYMRTFEDLKTVLNVMNSDLRRTIADGLRTGISQGLAEGRSIESVTRSLMNDVVNGVDRIGVTRARMIARTETVRAHHLANINEYRQFDSDLQITVQAEWETANDLDVCDDCLEMAAKGPYSLDAIEGLIPYHPNCVTADTTIVTSGILAGMSANYSGPIIKMRFSNGARLSVTPNHMLATLDGFVMAKFLSQGDTILSCTNIEGISIIDPDDDQNPSRIDNIVRALSESSCMASRAVPVSPIDFHGDGRRCQGDVDIVFSNGLLSNNFNSQFSEMLNQFKLDSRGMFDVLFGDGSFDEIVKTSPLSLNGGMGGTRELKAFLLGHLRHAKIHGFTTISGDEAILLKADSDTTSFDAEISRQLFNRCPGVISLQELSDIYVQAIMGLPPDIKNKSGLNDSNLDGIPFGHAIGPGELGKIFSGKISLISIIDIEIEQVQNLRVYDVTSLSTTYFANGVLSSNCRCAAIPYIEGMTANSKRSRRAA